LLINFFVILPGAVAPIWLALLPKDVEEPRGGYVWLKKQIVDWIHGPMPGKFSQIITI